METRPGWHQITQRKHSFWVPDSTHLSLPGVDLALRDSGGDGPLVVLLHGWCADGVLNFAPAFEPLVDAGYRAVALDLPGCGATRDSQQFSLERCAEVVGLAIDALGSGPAVVVGFSMGGAVTQLLSRERPELVDAVLFVATAAKLASHQLSRSELQLASHLLDLPASMADKVARLPLLGGQGDGEQEGLLSHVGWWLRRSHLRDSLEAGRELSSFDSSSWVAELCLPAVSIVTTEDHLVDPVSQQRLAALSHASVIEVAAGHLLVTEARFGQLLVEALMELSAVCAGAAHSSSHD